MSLDIEVRGDPGGCREAARRLARLAAVVDVAGDSLVRQAHLSGLDFGGLSGDTFRDHTGRLAASADRVSRRCTRLSRALDELALDLEDVRSLLEQAAEAARPWLSVSATAIRPPAVDPRPDDPWVRQAWAAWHRAVLLVDRARAVEHRAQHDWRTALGQLAGATPPEPPWDLDDITDGEWPDVAGPPAYDPALGPHLAHAAPAPSGDRPPRPEAAGHAAHPATTVAAAPASGDRGDDPADRGDRGTGRTWGFGVVTTWHAALWHPPEQAPPAPACGTTPVPGVLGATG